MSATLDSKSRRAFIEANTQFMRPPHVPEIELRLAAEIYPIWRQSEEALAAQGVPPPYWAFAWAGGQALARYALDKLELFAGKHVLDLGAGSGIEAIAAAMSGAIVTAADIDPFAAEAMAMNAARAGVRLHITTADMLETSEKHDIILVGDLFYEAPLAARVLAFAERQAAAGALVLIGDPGRTYLPRSRLDLRAVYHIATSRELEDNEVRKTSVYALTPPG